MGGGGSRQCELLTNFFFAPFTKSTAHYPVVSQQFFGFKMGQASIATKLLLTFPEIEMSPIFASTLEQPTTEFTHVCIIKETVFPLSMSFQIVFSIKFFPTGLWTYIYFISAPSEARG